MASYYVHIPGSEMPTAEVEATSTKHARTAYLDYLSRNSLIGWSDRQSSRKLVQANSMQPGSIQTQVQLDYDQEPAKEVIIPREVPEEVEPTEESSPPLSPPTTTTKLSSLQMFPKTQNNQDVVRTGQLPSLQPKTEQRPPPDLFGNSPIIQLSRKSKGV